MSEGLRGVLLQRHNADRGDAARTDGIDPKNGDHDALGIVGSHGAHGFLAHHAVLNWCARASAAQAQARAGAGTPMRTHARVTRD